MENARKLHRNISFVITERNSDCEDCDGDAVSDGAAPSAARSSRTFAGDIQLTPVDVCSIKNARPIEETDENG